jgi:hypothetical protein
VFGITIGYLLKLTHRYKGIQITGLCIRIIGMGLVVYTTTSTEISVAAFALIPGEWLSSSALWLHSTSF